MVYMLQVEPPCLFTGDHIFVGGCGESFIFVQAHQLVITHAQTLFIGVYGLVVDLHCLHSLQHATREGNSLVPRLIFFFRVWEEEMSLGTRLGGEGVGDFVTCVVASGTQ